MDVFFSIFTEASVRAIFNELEAFHLQSGFTVSYDKTTLYRIGSLRHSNAAMYNLDQVQWSNQDITVLGVIISNEEILNKNYEVTIEKVKRVLGSWENRNLTLMGKVQVVNTLVASLFVYKMMVLPCIPTTIVKRIENIIREYIWNGKKSKIAFNTLQLPKQEGGLNLVNLTKKDCALKATWPQILYQEHEYSEMVYGIMRVSVLKHKCMEMYNKPRGH